MAREKAPEEMAAAAAKKRLQGEKKQIRMEQKSQRKEAKRRAKEIARQEEELDEERGNGLATFAATLLVVALWIAVICVIIKLDVGGFGSSIMTPLLQDVPVVNRILPGDSLTETTDGGNYGGYTSLKDAVAQIKALELELERAQSASTVQSEEIDTLKAEVLRLQEFEKQQTEFERIRNEFYEEVVYSEKGPGAEEYAKYYETLDPTTAEYLYKQVIAQQEESQEIQDYAAAYSSASMKPKEAAAIFESMTDNLDLAARILNEMSAADRGAILGVMDSDVAAKLTKIMDPES